MVANSESQTSSNVRYVLEPAHSVDQAIHAADAQGITRVYWLSQRDSRLGWIGEQQRPAMPSIEDARHAWGAARPIMLPGFVAAAIPAHRQHIGEAASLMEAVLDGADCEGLLLEDPYAERLAPRFELLSASHDEGDRQEIVKIEFDVVDNDEIIAENLWVKLSWLSYEEHDASLRFRFSFGLENYEDVAADPERQAHAAALTEAVFPESALISADPALYDFLCQVLHAEDITYVERIVYFNAPEGGAQFHHDVERGHAGVVYAQVSGRTAWLALSTAQLLDALQDFLAQDDADKTLETTITDNSARQRLVASATRRAELSGHLHDRDNDPLELLINRSPAFIRHLIERGHGYILNPGDALLLPQHDTDHCSWHAVYCLDDAAGEGLSFAVRRTAR